MTTVLVNIETMAAFVAFLLGARTTAWMRKLAEHVYADQPNPPDRTQGTYQISAAQFRLCVESIHYRQLVFEL